MSEEEKKQIESSFRRIFQKIKNQLRNEFRQENSWENFIFTVPGGSVKLFSHNQDEPHPEFQERDTITTDEIIEFSQNLSKIKQIHGKEKLEN